MVSFHTETQIDQSSIPFSWPFTEQLKTEVLVRKFLFIPFLCIFFLNKRWDCLIAFKNHIIINRRLNFFTIRLSFRNCISCVFNCDNLCSALIFLFQFKYMKINSLKFETCSYFLKSIKNNPVHLGK